MMEKFYLFVCVLMFGDGFVIIESIVGVMVNEGGDVLLVVLEGDVGLGFECVGG